MSSKNEFTFEVHVVSHLGLQQVKREGGRKLEKSLQDTQLARSWARQEEYCLI